MAAKWQNTLNKRVFLTEKYLPALWIAAAQYQNRQAFYLLARILMDACRRKNVNPLKVLYEPEQVLKNDFGAECPDVLPPLSEMFFETQTSVLQSVIRQAKKEFCGECPECSPKRESHPIKGCCEVPTILLWRSLLDPTLLNPDSIITLRQSLEKVIKILKSPGAISGYENWLHEQPDDRETPYSTEHVLFVFVGLDKIAEHMMGNTNHQIICQGMRKEIQTDYGISPRGQSENDMITIFEHYEGVNIGDRKERIAEAQVASMNAPVLERRIFHFLLNEMSQ
ncbi:MAG TPA: hypothetical protein PLH19_00170 [Anaerolineae bacterium]|nr:hypothetical protein [Anaerolineae bacterium]HQH36936.1 hypothetical protein [Anaerolineae bacterium]